MCVNQASRFPILPRLIQLLFQYKLQFRVSALVCRKGSVRVVAALKRSLQRILMMRRPAQRAIFEESCSSFNYTNSFSARGPDRCEMDDGVYQVGRHGWNNNYRIVPRAYFSYFIVTSGLAVVAAPPLDETLSEMLFLCPIVIIQWAANLCVYTIINIHERSVRCSSP